MPEAESQTSGGFELPLGLERSARVRSAWSFAADAHRGQRRKGDGEPYLRHPLEVAEIIAEHGASERQLIAAFLHDVLEDTGAAPARIAERFGPGVAKLVSDLSDDPAIEGYEERKRALREQVRAAGEEAQLIYAADKLANCRELIRCYRAEGEAIAGRYKAPLPTRLRIWRDDLEMVRAELGEGSLVAELGAQLDELEAELEPASA